MTRDEVEQRKKKNFQRRIDETIVLCTEFLLTNASDIDLANRLRMSSSTVGRRLTDKTYVVQAYEGVKQKLLNAGIAEKDIPATGDQLFLHVAKKRQENLLRGKALGGQTTLLNHVYLKEDDSKFNGVTKLSLSAFYSNTEKQYHFLANAALYFRLHFTMMVKTKMLLVWSL